MTTPIKDQEVANRAQHMRVFETDATSKLEIVYPDHQCHWRRSKGGWAQIEFTMHKRALWLAIDTIEHADTGGSKRTMMTLDATELQALRTMLNKVLG